MHTLRYIKGSLKYFRARPRNYIVSNIVLAKGRKFKHDIMDHTICEDLNNVEILHYWYVLYVLCI